MSLRSLVLVDDSGRELVLTEQPIAIGSAYECSIQLDGVAPRHVQISSDKVEAIAECLVGHVPLGAGQSRRLAGASVLQVGRSELKICERWNVEGENTVGIGLAMAELATSPEVLVVEGSGNDLARSLTLQEGSDYVVGRASNAALSLDDSAVSREHLVIRYQRGRVLVRDNGSTRGAFLGTTRLLPERLAVWAPEHMLLVGRTVLALRMPTGHDALRERIDAADPAPSKVEEPKVEAPEAPVAPPASLISHMVPMAGAPMAEPPLSPAVPVIAVQRRWRPIDIIVFAGAGIFALFAVIAVLYVLL
jgi:hypothetical protein